MYGYWTHCFYSCDSHAYESYLKTGKKLPMAQFDKNSNVTQPLGCPQSTAAHHNHLKSSSSNHSDSNLGGSIIENSEKMSLNGGHGNQTRFTLSSTSDNGIDVDGSTCSQQLLDENNTSELDRRKLDEPVKVKHAMTVPANLNSLIKDLSELWIISPRPPHSSDVSFHTLHCFETVSIS